MSAVDWAAFETPLDEKPEFFVQAPDGKKEWAELNRQATFMRLAAQFAPRCLIYATANAGKRNPRQAKAEGIKAGTFDVCCLAKGPRTAFVEFKGYSGKKQRRPGMLSDAQIRFGNRCTQFGIPAACFFDPYDAMHWLREQGFPVMEFRDAA